MADSALNGTPGVTVILVESRHTGSSVTHAAGAPQRTLTCYARRSTTKTWSQNPSVVARRRKLIRVAARVSRGRRVRSVLS